MKEKFVIAQVPNWQLIVMFIGWLGIKLTDGDLFTLSKTIYYVAGIIWAYEELFNGVNWFRKVLGGVVITLLIYRLFIDLV